MECMCAQTRPRFILSSERVLGYGVRTHVDSREIGTLEANLPGTWRYRVGTRTGWPEVSIL